MLARCRAPNITEYYASVLKPGTTQLLIIMELMAASAADLVCPGARQQPAYCCYCLSETTRCKGGGETYSRGAESTACCVHIECAPA